ncbi:MAG: hypothetical protein HYW26_03450 [Candidatus Aenigmarchaeota archaeon]|nr:hypothetical protein [Candidatus Aenigmarchaeota archaeon]
MNKVPKRLLRSCYRKEMWKNSEKIMKDIENIIPVSSAYVLGSFVSKKRRPADVDFIILLKTKSKARKWSVDMVIAPDNKYGKYILEDAKLWVKQSTARRNRLL